MTVMFNEASSESKNPCIVQAGNNKCSIEESLIKEQNGEKESRRRKQGRGESRD